MGKYNPSVISRETLMFVVMFMHLSDPGTWGELTLFAISTTYIQKYSTVHGNTQNN